ncbi:MAG: hypothetical protein WDA22_01480 [Bacteroidota bacterium]
MPILHIDEHIDMHVHVGLLGDQWGGLGKMSDWFTRQPVFKIFLLYARIDPDIVCDQVLHEKTIETINTSTLDRVVCLALDPVFDIRGNERKELSHMWIDNAYIQKLQKDAGEKVLFGASVHPYDPKFKKRIAACVDQGAVLLKWLPSAQQINLADERVAEAMKFLATAKNGKPLPLLLHVGPEYAIESSDQRTKSYDFLTWGFTDNVKNWFLGRDKWFVPEVEQIRSNIRTGLDEGMTIIFAHCGLPYFASGIAGKFLEHSDFNEISEYLNNNKVKSYNGQCFADVSAFCTPFRQNYFEDVAKLPSEYLIFGSDFPTPAFELTSDIREKLEDLKAILKGEFDRIIIPQDNLLDVNYRELNHAFPGHAMFTNFSKLIK